MKSPDERLLHGPGMRARQRGDYSLHPVTALDGALMHVTLNGETVGFYFGATEEEAAEAMAAEVLGRITSDAKGTGE